MTPASRQQSLDYIAAMVALDAALARSRDALADVEDVLGDLALRSGADVSLPAAMLDGRLLGHLASLDALRATIADVLPTWQAERGATS